ncbi:MAG: hypothetical protein RSF42_03410 [Comamonas sp.]
MTEPTGAAFAPVVEATLDAQAVKTATAHAATDIFRKLRKTIPLLSNSFLYATAKQQGRSSIVDYQRSRTIHCVVFDRAVALPPTKAKIMATPTGRVRAKLIQ